MRRKHSKNYDKKKMAINLIVIIIVCLIIIFESNIFYKGFKSDPEESDVIIVLGCAVWGYEPSPTLNQRILKAYELYKEGWGKKIIATGSKGDGENVFEAEAIKRSLAKMGVPESDIIEERKSTSTKENLFYAKEIMDKYGYKDAVIVTNYYHIYRSGMIANDLNMKASFGKADIPQSKVTLVVSNIKEVMSLLKYFTLRIV